MTFYSKNIFDYNLKACRVPKTIVEELDFYIKGKNIKTKIEVITKLKAYFTKSEVM